MVKTNQGTPKNYRIKPLTFPTPLRKDESLASWLVRAALKHGCTPLTFTYFFWPEYRIWTYDVDKGFEHIDSNIHSDMAVLAKTTSNIFNKQTLMSFTKKVNASLSDKHSLTWVLPLSKRNRYSKIGYPYCSECMKNSKSAYLKLHWRFSWTVCCTEHKKLLETNCPHCEHPYQPQLLKPDQGFINHCHLCHNELGKERLNTELGDSIYQYQLLTNRVFHEEEGSVLGENVSLSDWFNYLLFLINMVRLAVRNPNYMFGKLLMKFGADISDLSLPKTALRFDYLPVEERIVLLEQAYYLLQINADTWLNYCQELNITQNSFKWSKHTVVPAAFHKVYAKLPKTPLRRYKAQLSDLQPASPEAVMASWNRLQRKIEMANKYDKHLNEK